MNATPSPKQSKDVDSSQQDIIDFVSDPENVKKAVEGSMDKRLKVMDSSLPPDGCICSSFWTVRQAHKSDCPLSPSSLREQIVNKADVSALRSGAWQLIRSKNTQPDENLVDGIVALALTFVSKELVTTYIEVAEIDKRIDEIYRTINLVKYPNGKDYEYHSMIAITNKLELRLKDLQAQKAVLDHKECEHTDEWDIMEHKKNHCPDYEFGAHYEDRNLSGGYICGCEDDCYKHKAVLEEK